MQQMISYETRALWEFSVIGAIYRGFSIGLVQPRIYFLIILFASFVSRFVCSLEEEG